MVSSLLRARGQKHSRHRWYFGPLRAPLAPAPYYRQRQCHQSMNSALLMAISGLICEACGRSGPSSFGPLGHLSSTRSVHGVHSGGGPFGPWSTFCPLGEPMEFGWRFGQSMERILEPFHFVHAVSPWSRSVHSVSPWRSVYVAFGPFVGHVRSMRREKMSLSCRTFFYHWLFFDLLLLHIFLLLMFFNLAAVVFIFLSSLQPIRRTCLDCTSDKCRECFQSRSQHWPRGGVFSQAVALCMRFCESRDICCVFM